MTISNVVKVTDEGLFIPHEALKGFGEIEVVRTPDSIIIQPKYKSRQEVLQVLHKTGLLLKRQQALLPQPSISPAEQTELAHKFSAGQPLSEIIIKEREERW